MLLNHAQGLYNFATNSSSSQRTYQTSVPSVGAAYASSGYTDELAIASLFMALASNSADAYAQAVKTYQQENLLKHLQDDAVFNWDEKTPGVAVLGAQIASTYPDLTSQQSYDFRSDAETFFDRIVTDQSRAFVTDGTLIESVIE